MSLTLVTTDAEPLVSPAVVRALRAALSQGGAAVLLVPTFAQELEARRALAAERGLALGVDVTTPMSWAEERWGVWGDGRRLVDGATRSLVARRVLARAGHGFGSPLEDAPGTAALIADLARTGLPWLVGASAPEGVTRAERAAVATLEGYRSELGELGLVEPCEVMATLPGLVGAGPGMVCAGFSELSRAERELLCGLAVAREVTLFARVGERPASALARSMLEQLRGLAVARGAAVGERAETGDAPAPQRPAELSALMGALFCAGAPQVRPTGALRLLLPAGPSAEGEAVASELRCLADAGLRDVVVVAPDAAEAWRSLAPRLAARGVSCRAQLSSPLPRLESGRAFLEFARSVARLAALAETWPSPVPVPDAPKRRTVRVSLPDMSWWPPRELSDFLLSEVSGVSTERARALDAEWRGNRLLTPPALLDQLQSPRDVSPEVAAATRELLKGRLGSAASRLLGPLARGERPEAALSAEASGVLSAVLATAQSLKQLGCSVEGGTVTLSQLVSLAADALERTRVPGRPELVCEGAACAVRVMGPREAARLEPGSADALVLLGQTSVASPVPAADDVRSELLAAYGVEPAPRAMDALRARFAALVAVPRRALVLERTLFGADGKECYPSVMLSELLAAYGIAADAKVADVARALGEGCVVTRGETRACENASRTGVAAARTGSEAVAPAGRISESERACVMPPLEGMDADEARPLLSASQIETYLECPYKWFSLRRLRLGDADALFSGAETGTFAHRVLELTRRELLARAVERARGERRLADMRAADPGAVERAEYKQVVEELAALAAADPQERYAGSAVSAEGALAEASDILGAHFDAHLSHQFQLIGGRRPLPQALVPHTSAQRGSLDALRRDLTSLLGFEAELFGGFEPRLFEWRFGHGGQDVTYAGVRLTGTVDRIDVDAHGQALVIDYKHKAAAAFAGEYDAFSQGAPGPGEFALPRRVQSLVYAQVARRAFPELTVRAGLYLCTKGAHALAGAVDENLADVVFGARQPSAKRLAQVSVPRGEGFGQAGASGMEALLDACEEAIAARLERLRAGNIEAAPLDAEACHFCPVLNCERRLQK